MFPVSHWCNVLPLKTFYQLGLKRVQLQSSKTNLLSYGGHKGKHNTTMQISKYQISKSCQWKHIWSCWPTFRTDSMICILLSHGTFFASLQAWLFTRIIPEDIPSDYNDAFKGIRHLPAKQEIKIDLLVPPVIHLVVYRYLSVSKSSKNLIA